MINKPFRFNSSNRDANLLLNKLEYIGLSRKETIEKYKKEIWIMECPWKPNDTILLAWEHNFGGDGWNKEDDLVQLIINDTIIAEVDIAVLLKTPLKKPIREIIIEKVTKMVGVYTGKKI